MELEIDRWISATSAVMQSLDWTVGVKENLSQNVLALLVYSNLGSRDRPHDRNNDICGQNELPPQGGWALLSSDELNHPVGAQS